MSEASERIKEALAAHIEYLEMGGPLPDTSHLTDSERDELNVLIEALESTEGVAFGLGRREETASTEAPAETKVSMADEERQEYSAQVLAMLRDAMPGDVHIDSEPARLVSLVGGVEILDGWTVGTFGGRIRVWLLAVGSAQELESNSDSLSDLGRIFGALPDTAAIALVAEDLTCLIVQPEDCAPQIHIPSGSLVSRRYRQPIRPVGEAVFAFLNELIPYWDPIPAFEQDSGLTIDVPAVSQEIVQAAIDRQRGIGERARKGNPKKEVLMALGKKEVSALARLANGLFDGSIDSEDIESRIERLAKSQ